MSKIKEEYEMILDISSFPDKGSEDEQIAYLATLDEAIKEKIELIKEKIVNTQGKELLEKGKESNGSLATLMTNNEWSISKESTEEGFTVDVRLVKVLRHTRVTIKIPNQVHKTDDEGNIVVDKDVS